MKAISRDSQQITELLEIGWMVSVVTENNNRGSGNVASFNG